MRNAPHFAVLYQFKVLVTQPKLFHYCHSKGTYTGGAIYQPLYLCRQMIIQYGFKSQTFQHFLDNDQFT